MECKNLGQYHQIATVLACFGFLLTGAAEAESNDARVGGHKTEIVMKGKVLTYSDEDDRRLQMRCGKIAAQLTCKHSISREARNEGPLLCNDNELLLTVGGAPLEFDLEKIRFEWTWEGLKYFSTPVGFSCSVQKNVHVLYVTLSFGYSGCGSKCENTVGILETGKIVGEYDIGPWLPLANRLNEVRIER